MHEATLTSKRPRAQTGTWTGGGEVSDGTSKTKKAKPGQPSNMETATKKAIDDKAQQRTIGSMFGRRNVEVPHLDCHQ